MVRDVWLKPRVNLSLRDVNGRSASSVFSSASESVAQLVEHRTFNAVVAGSSPARLTISFKRLGRYYEKLREAMYDLGDSKARSRNRSLCLER